MAKEIIKPTDEWIDKWLDKYEESHPNEKLDYNALREQAETEWWDRQVELGNPTPFDLTAEQEKASKKARSTGERAQKEPVKRERKPNETKRLIMQLLHNALTEYNAVLTNIERTVDFEIDGIKYSVTLTEHRKKKEE